MSASTVEPIRKPIDKYIPWFFVVFFLVLSCLMGWFAWLANSTDRGVVSTHAYENGIAYNHILEKQRAQDALGWDGQLTIDKTATSPAHADFVLLDKQHAPIKDAQVQLTLIRPTQGG
ncbi:MAG: FixH family protein, partial [Alphaproteobacteria bacterium]|nr:FixH family protein [Alphaproteobacteria bacterium]